MAININPNRINVQTGSARLAEQRRRQQTEADAPVITPRRADVNTIPSTESLQTMIRSAAAAIRKGVFWDRGTILNLLV